MCPKIRCDSYCSNFFELNGAFPSCPDSVGFSLAPPACDDWEPGAGGGVLDRNTVQDYETPLTFSLEPL